MLDAFAVVALLRGEPAAEEVRSLLPEAVLTSTGLAEVVDQLVRVHGQDADEVVLDLAELGLLDAMPVDPSDGVAVGLLRAAHYHRARRAVSLADCVVAQAARRLGAAVATADPHLLDLCHEEGIEVIALPSSSGSRWRPA